MSSTTRRDYMYRSGSRDPARGKEVHARLNVRVLGQQMPKKYKNDL
jgi:hypothetical protein